MGPLAALLAFPVSGPIGAVTWIARQVAAAARRELLDPARIEAALLALEHRLEAGTIDEAGFEAEEAALLEELAEIRALRAEADETMAPDAAGEAEEADGAAAEVAGDAPNPTAGTES